MTLDLNLNVQYEIADFLFLFHSTHTNKKKHK